MLHVTNGSVALSRLHDLGLPGTIVPWDDVLHEGPVPSDLSAAEFRRRRADFLASTREDAASIERSLEARDARLSDAADGDEVVLWFEHDLYDQLQVLQVLDHLAGCGSRRTARVTAILADDYLAAQPEARLQEWFDTRRELTAAEWQAAGVAWHAYRQSDPTALVEFDHPGAWPTLRAALRRHLQQFPWTGDGLSRTERQTLSALAHGPRSPRSAFVAANHEVEEAIFMGDLGWWFHIRTLITGPRPLIEVSGTAPADFHDFDWWRDDESTPLLALTDDGRHVIAGRADRVALNGLDRWLGGVHLQAAPGAAVWRWANDRNTLEKI